MKNLKELQQRISDNRDKHTYTHVCIGKGIAGSLSSKFDLGDENICIRYMDDYIYDWAGTLAYRDYYILRRFYNENLPNYSLDFQPKTIIPIMKAPFKMFNITPGITEVKFKGPSSCYFMRNEFYPVRKIETNRNVILTTDETGHDHTLSLSYLNEYFELVNPCADIQALKEILLDKVAEKDLEAMEEVFAALKQAVDNSIPKITPENIWDGALFESEEFYILVVECPQQGFRYMRTLKDKRKWQMSTDASTEEELAKTFQRLKYTQIHKLPTL